MADVKAGTAGKETVAPSYAEGRTNEAQALDAFASAKRMHRESDSDERPEANSQKSRRKVPLLWAALGLALTGGIGFGWLGHVKARADEAAKPCKAWADTICERMGELAYECTHAKAAGALLDDSACALAQKTVLTKIDAIKAERVPCRELTSKVCADLGPAGKACELAKAKEPTFSIEDCQDMTKRYPRVLARITERQAKGTLPNPPRAPRNLTIEQPN